MDESCMLELTSETAESPIHRTGLWPRPSVQRRIPRAKNFNNKNTSGAGQGSPELNVDDCSYDFLRFFMA